MLEIYRSTKIYDNTLFIYCDDKSNCYGPDNLSIGKWFWSHSKRFFNCIIKEFILEKVAEKIVEKKEILKRYESYKKYLEHKKLYLKEEKRNIINSLLELLSSLYDHLNQETFDEISKLLLKLDLNIEFYFYKNYKEALELVKEHDRLIYSYDLIKTFKEDNTLNFIEINKEVGEGFLRDLYFTRFFDREDYKEIPTFYEYGPNHPFYKELIIKALKENRPITEEDIDEMIRKYPFDKNLIY